ncbi:MAG TPA: TetR/AcrR family transcriptional regulator [Dictyobacter sp.]|jgi:AcrR family transcriptional regulator|nr:TetR/AcrR family transcriptional regulator [Dictyobacter sp.]
MPKIVSEETREATRRHIMRQAAKEFARLGFDQANINLIAEQAGIGKGTIYLYFENKRELFLAMLRSIAQDQLSIIRTALAPEGSLQQRIERLFLAFARLAAEEGDSFNVYMSALYGVNRAFKTEAVRLLRDYLAIISLMLEEGKAHGEIQYENVESAALLVLSSTEAYILSAQAIGLTEQAIARQASAVVQIIVQGLAVKST